MYNFLKKELTIIISSGQLFITGFSFLIATGLIIWIFPGRYNVFENGYAGLYSFFILAPVLFLIIIPVLTMRSFAEEKRNGTSELLFTYPVSILQILTAKVCAIMTVIFLLLCCTVFYWICIYSLANPHATIEWGVMISGYIGLLFIALVFTTIGLFTSSLTNNQLIAFITAICFCIFFYWGIDVMLPLISAPDRKLIIQQFGIPFHLDPFINGIISLRNLSYFLCLSILFFSFTIFYYCKNKRIHFPGKAFLTTSVLFLFLVLLPVFLHVRIDMTADKRYSLSDYTKNLLRKNTDPMHVTIYLDGEMDAGFLRLQHETVNLIKELNTYTSSPITYSFYNPNEAENDSGRTAQRNTLLKRNMNDEIITETDRKGSIKQMSVFPWADLVKDKDTIAISLFTGLPGKSQQENIRISVNELEFKFSESIAFLSGEEVKDIAFLEGHGEIPDIYVYDIEEELSRYYNVYRGSLTEELKEIPAYRAIIIAGPEERFSEKEKFLLDQYLMKGGNILLLINSANVSYESLQQTGESPSIVNDINLNDLLFHYGLRINPVLVQDLQCAAIPLKTGNDNTYHHAPWYYAPLLNASSGHPVTAGLPPVKAEFAGSIDFISTHEQIQQEILLSTSAYTHVVSIPEMILAEDPSIRETREYFNKSHLPVAVLLEGKFSSAFKNRMAPDGLNKVTDATSPGKIIVAASGSMIRNEIQWTDNNTGIPLPLGYDRYMDIQFGNKSFILNAVNYLAGKEERLLLRNKETILSQLDKTRVNEEKPYWQVFNMGLPVIFLLGILFAFNTWRKKKFGK